MEGRGRRKIPVVYYLSRNRHLEHPHFIEVPLSSPEGLYLRDLIHRLNAVRGKGIAASYSWSCKRSYKNGFVWHDLSEDDLILPANGNEYVLKGSELLDQSPTGIYQATANPKPGNQIRPRQEIPVPVIPPKPKSKENSPSSSSSSPPPIPSKRPKPLSPLSHSSRDEERERDSPSSLSSQSPNQSRQNPQIKPVKSSIDASTQTEEQKHETLKKSREISVSTDTTNNGFSDPELTNFTRTRNCTKSETLESLIRSEARKINQIRVLNEDEEIFLPSLNPKLSPTSYLMQLITCGSISVKNNNNNRYGFVSRLNNYRPNYFQMELPSPIYGNSMRFLTRVEDKEYFSGSIVETNWSKENNNLGEKIPILKKSSSYNAERSSNLTMNEEEDEIENGESASRLSCLPRTIKLITSPLADCPRISNGGQSQSQTPLGGSRRITVKASPEPSRKDKEEKVMRIEERLTSGARVVIQSRVPCDDDSD